MHSLLRRLARQRQTAQSSYGLTVAAVVLVTLLRLAAPLNAAPFLLFAPLVFLLALAFGAGPGIVAVLLSGLSAAMFFVRGDPRAGLPAGQVVALVQWVVLGLIMTAICDALRRVVLENEAQLADLQASRRSLEAARDEAEAARTQAEDANRAKSTFIANMSHELRTPLSAIIGFSEMMAEEITDGCTADELAADLAKVEGNARHLLGLINDVLDLSKVESGKMDIFAERFAVEPMLREVAATVDALVTKKGNTLRLAFADGLGDAHTDLVKLRQVLLNLLGNAAKFTEGGEITLAAERAQENGRDVLRLAVQDTGIGMSAEQLGRLFQRFAQADASTTRRFGGTGLGLALSRAFAAMLGGSVAVESAEGRGSRFTLTVPAEYVAPEAAAAAVVPEGEEDPAWDLVLVIDDDADQRALMARALRRERFRVMVAADGASGLALAREARPQLITLDVLMPGVDGWSVLAALKAEEALAAIPIVMVTSVDQRSLAASLGAADYMLKPVDWNRLRALVGRFHATPHAKPGEILLVEDEWAVRADIRAVLEDDGWTVTEASDGAAALALAAEGRFAMVLLDLGMPVMDGFRFLDELRRLPGCDTLPVVVLTGRELSREDRQRLRGASQILHMGEGDLAGLTERLGRVAALPAD